MIYILITGSARGLGLEIAKMLEAEDVTLLLTSRNEMDMSTFRYAKQHKFLKADFTKDVSSIYEYIIEHKIILSGIVHNVGGRLEGDVHPIEKEVLKKTMMVNLYGAVSINSALLDKHIKPHAKIIHIGSNIALSGNASPSYAISKAALNTYVKNIARKYAKDSFSICSVLPGAMEHEGSDWAIKKIQNSAYYEKVKSSFPQNKFCDTNEVAQFVCNLFTLSGDIVNGSLFTIDGGV